MTSVTTWKPTLSSTTSEPAKTQLRRIFSRDQSTCSDTPPEDVNRFPRPDMSVQNPSIWQAFVCDFRLINLKVVVTWVYRAIKFKYSSMFSFVTEEVSEARKRAEQEGTRGANSKGRTLKLVGNRYLASLIRWIVAWKCLNPFYCRLIVSAVMANA